jgi:hypothetical protein
MPIPVCRLGGWRRLRVGRADSEPRRAAVQDVGVDHRCGHVGVAEEF